jgi:hypothetical protein
MSNREMRLVTEVGSWSEIKLAIIKEYAAARDCQDANT